MQQFTGFFITIALILILVISSKYFAWWAKILIMAYYGVISYLFITVTNRIDKKYEDVIPVPDAYWDENTEWVSTISTFLFLPLVGILIFIYFKWFVNVKTTTARVLISLSLVPAAIIVFLFYFFFNFAYGYRP